MLHRTCRLFCVRVRARSWLVALSAAFLTAATGFALDRDGNGQSDIWEMLYNATGLTASADADGDHVSNREEATAGTDPHDPDSYPAVAGESVATNRVRAMWSAVPGKRYYLEGASSPTDSWQSLTQFDGAGGTQSGEVDASAAAQRYLRVRIVDVDSDGDSINDWEEEQIGFDPTRSHTERYSNTDSQRVATALSTISTVIVSVIDGDMSERWPDPGVVAVRRSGGIKPLTVNFTLTGSATRDEDYTTSPGNSIAMPPGVREVWLSFDPVADADDAESNETIVVTLAAGSNYVVGAMPSATVTLANETPTSPPCAKAAARFLVQAAFGPNADSPDDPDLIPENVEEVMALGYEGWIDQQFARPVATLLPFVDYAPSIPELYTDHKEVAWWNRAMGVTNLYPGGPVVQPDPLRQRMAFALSQIMVVSDRLEALGASVDGMATYYDVLLTKALGNYRQLLFDITCNPAMGLYLSHLKNRKPDPINNIFPDENYAREVMQLFSIGLWELKQDGTRRLDGEGHPIPTYDNDEITEFARVFTGMSYNGTNVQSFLYAPQNLRVPMKMWDEYHDCDAKTLLNGQAIPARTPSNPDNGAACLADINAAVDNLFWHTNVAPFIGKQLIQRFVTSNPSTGYVARVSSAFNDNGSGVRGDLKAVIKAILLDPEARDPSKINDPTFGKLREPLLRVANLAYAFNASAPCGFFALDQFYLDHYEEPMKAPSVFNFYLPHYIPPGPIGDAGLVGPEFQIVNAGSAMSVPNYYYNAVRYDLHRWGSADPTRAVKLDLTQIMMLVTNQADELVRRLDLPLTCGTMEPRTFQIVREAIERVDTYLWEWDKERAWMAVYLVVTSPEFSVLR